jgi:glycosyltransferase involved in cell wall biosynthesis
MRIVPVATAWPWVSSLLTHQLGRPALKQRVLAAAFRTPFDVVHYHNVSLLGGPGALAFGGRVRLYTAHEHWLVCPTHVLWKNGAEPCETRACVRCSIRQHRPPQLWRFGSRLPRALSRMHAVIAQSEFSRERHRQFGLRQAMRVLPPFLPDALPALPATHLPAIVQRVLADASPFILFVGRLETSKGLSDVLPLFSGSRVDASVRLIVVGDGSERAHIERVAEGNNRITVTGRLQASAIDALRDRALAQVVPSLGYETFGLVLVEAMQRGTLVIARRRGPFPELIELAGTGALFDTADELAVLIQRALLDERWRADARRRGPNAVAVNWSEAAVMPRYTALLEELGAWTPSPSAPANAAASTVTV